MAPVRHPIRLELSRARHRDLPRQAVAAADSKVAGRPDVQATELEHEKHLGRRGTEYPNGGLLELTGIGLMIVGIGVLLLGAVRARHAPT
jgi:hypothetical protein